MDYVDCIVHVFSAEKRAFYGLERLRKSATSISVADLNAELKSRISTARAKVSKAKPAVKKSPAAKKAVPAKKVATKKVAVKKVAAKKAPAKAAKKAGRAK